MEPGSPGPVAAKFLDQDVKTAQRSYLQRCEVRLSTMHRIAGAFVSGAALLILLPLFLKDAMSPIVRTFLSPIMHNSSSQMSDWTTLALHLTPFVIALLIPLSSLYLLLQDLILFYFSASIPDSAPTEGQDAPFHPRFALTAIPFSDDEGPELKHELRQIQFRSPMSNFLLPHHKAEKAWLSRLIKTEEGGSVALPEGSKFLSGLPQGNEDNKLMRMAFGLAGAYDRTLPEEVAKMELSLIRHNLLLRRLVMRYMKALILFIWTGIVLFPLVAFLESIQTEHGELHSSEKTWTITVTTNLELGLIGLSAALLCWSIFAPFFVRSPIRWVYREFNQNSPDSTRDEHLVKFEHRVIIFCFFASVCPLLEYAFGSRTEGRLLLAVCAALGALFNSLTYLRNRGKLDAPAFRWL